MRALILILAVSFTASAFAQVDRNYFQQEVNYSIDVKLDDIHHTLTGFERIEYINHSPHTLTYLYFHLWPNAYKNKSTALAKQLVENGESEILFANPQNELGYIDGLQFIVNNDTIKWEYDSVHVDIAILYLNKPLSPKDTLHISTPFFVKLPGNFSRLGHVGQSYQISQWYPKPAVYDSHGWNQMPYLDQGEFYSEFGSFDVRITVPKNYVVAATGDLYECPEEEKWLENSAKQTQALFDNHKTDKFGRLEGQLNDDFPPSSKEWKILRYKQNNVHDFAWFADKRFYILRGEYNLPQSGRNVTLWSFFTKSNSAYWKKSINYLHDAIKYYSQWNGEYPYNVVSAVDGTISAGGGMEYPTVTVIGDVNSDLSLETVIVHEVGHNWFYGILGSNEREHPWMDEGLNSFNELRYLETKYPELNLYNSMLAGLPSWNNGFGLKELQERYQYYLTYLFTARNNRDQAIEGKADEYSYINYAAIVYSKTAIAFDYLRAYLGEKVFDKCMHAYYDKWKFHHPEPEDIKAIFQEVSRKDLSWFFDDYLTSTDVIDYKIKRKKRVDTRSNTTFGWNRYEESIVVVNKGNAVVPFCIQGIKADTANTTVWYQGHKGKQTVHFPNGLYDYLTIDHNERIPEINRRNNRFKERALFHKAEPFRLRFLGGIEEPYKSVLYYSPVVGFNKYDGFMAGLLVYNNLFPQRNVEWQAMPFYGFNSNKPAGYLNVVHHINPRKRNPFSNIDYGLSVASFSLGKQKILDETYQYGYVKINPNIEFTFAKKKARSPRQHKIQLQSDFIIENPYEGCLGNCDDNLIGSLDVSNKLYNTFDYIFSTKNFRHLTVSSVHYQIQQAKDFVKTSLEGNIKWAYNVKGNFISARAFTGFFISNTTTSARYNWRMDGQHGFNDYTYSTPFIGRIETEGGLSKQFIENHGGLKILTAVAQSNNWLSALNLKASLPIPVIRLFSDFGISANKNNPATFVYDAGVYLSFLNGFMEIYFPFIYSKVIQTEYKANGRTMADGIRFTLNLNQANPFKQIKRLSR